MNSPTKPKPGNELESSEPRVDDEQQVKESYGDRVLREIREEYGYDMSIRRLWLSAANRF